MSDCELSHSGCAASLDKLRPHLARTRRCDPRDTGAKSQGDQGRLTTRGAAVLEARPALQAAAMAG
eukprot:7216030-Pyramimonas_sp.AAC.1